MPKFKNSNAIFWVIFKQCVTSNNGMVEANHLESIIWLFIWDGFLKTLKTILEFENSKGFFSHEFSSWLTGSRAEAKKLWTSIVFLIVLDHLLGAFIRGNYQQVIPEWLGSILKRAAFFIVTNLLHSETTATIFFSSVGPVQKSIQEAAMNQQNRIDYWSGISHH